MIVFIQFMKFQVIKLTWGDKIIPFRFYPALLARIWALSWLMKNGFKNNLFIHISIMVSVHQWVGRPRFIPRSSHTKDSKKKWIKNKWYLMPPFLTLRIIRYGSKLSRAIPGKEYHPLLHLGIVAIKKVAFGSPLIMVGQFTHMKHYLYMDIKLFFVFVFLNHLQDDDVMLSQMKIF